MWSQFLPVFAGIIYIYLIIFKNSILPILVGVNFSICNLLMDNDDNHLLMFFLTINMHNFLKFLANSFDHVYWEVCILVVILHEFFVCFRYKTFFSDICIAMIVCSYDLPIHFLNTVFVQQTSLWLVYFVFWLNNIGLPKLTNIFS